ncbi:antibiotic biosynthesis monooxygenase [Streptomyces sp. B-S-A8]|uniref:Antibiotic biosynthesis monooxygenase n=1 Tax=Streptomyces solicavernae TaxID=3043614 RepID=A0ABT6S0Z5_9ACTN|nr:antibiotic biosynthesis monooxygenase [Streptomyces sp. B-S-A8]MDI3390359.1 antibiotic biosynthesis monooxygenase [Streptomyces sp. B-S-A8]
MSSIRVEDGYFTLFNIFHTDGPQGQRRLMDQWRGLPPAHTQPGLVSGNFHPSTDGRSVVNYAQWESKDAYDAFRAESATRQRFGEAQTFSRMDSVPCEVVHTWQPVVELSVDKPWFTVAVVVRSEPRHQARVVREMTHDDPALGETPGYVNHAVHRGLSGEHVVKYAQWQDEDSFKAFLDRPQEPSPLDSFTTAELYFCRLEHIRGLS